ncbi:MAG TPA: UDP-N-acetylmuramoyl-L-alanine--D-glutamate ligase [Candidatus Saccharimonadales bacterium]
MKVAIIGYGVEGASSYEYYTEHGHEVTICDQSPATAVPDGAQTQLGSSYLDDLDRFDLLVRSAGIPPRVILDKSPDAGDKITTQLNEFLRVCPTKNVIGVTGTKGKGTTATLITKMFETAGRKVHLGGNIGVPPFSFLRDLTPDSWVVLELSSFQLIDIQFSPHIAVCLMVVPEHLNWHASMYEYILAKSQLFEHQTPGDSAIYFSGSKNSEQIAAAGKGRKIPYFAPPGAAIDNGAISISGQVVCPTSEIKLLGRHNWQNACAAVTAAWEAGLRDTQAMRAVLTSFAGLEYHLEFIRDLNGVQYYNDSFGTTPETAIVALEAFQQPKVLILGGGYKGVSFDELARVLKDNTVRRVVLIGNPDYPDDAKRQTAAPELEAALRAQHFDTVTSLVRPGGADMREIVEAAQKAAQPGDIILFSTACNSFDMFNNYKERGAAFTAAVKALR